MLLPKILKLSAKKIQRCCIQNTCNSLEDFLSPLLPDLQLKGNLWPRNSQDAIGYEEKKKKAGTTYTKI